MIAVLWVLGAVWCLSNTIIGIVLAALYGGHGWALRRGCIEVIVPRIPAVAVTAAAQTWGVVILAIAPMDAQMRAHERRHVVQQLVLGPLFLLLYPLASLVAKLRGQGTYHGNWFEADARRAAGESD